MRRRHDTPQNNHQITSHPNLLSLHENHEEMLDFCLTLHSCERWDELAQVCVTLLNRLIEARDVLWLEYFSQKQACIWSCAASEFQSDNTGKQTSPYLEDYIGQSTGLDPFYENVTALIDAECEQFHSLRNHFPADNLEQTAFYKNYMQPKGVHDLVVMQCYQAETPQTKNGSPMKSAVLILLELPDSDVIAEKTPLLKYFNKHLGAASQHLIQLSGHANLIAALGGLRNQTDTIGINTVSSDGSRLWDVDDAASDFIRKMGGFITADRQIHLPTKLKQWVKETIQNHSRICSQNTPFTRVCRTWNDERIRISLFLRGAGHGAVLAYQQLEDTSSRQRGKQETPETQLSPRELEVLCSISAGMNTQEVADSLKIGKRTVDKHLEHVFIKLGVNNRLAAIKIYRRLMSDSNDTKE